MRRFALIVGVEQYRDPRITQLRYASADAVALTERLRNRCGFERVIALCDKGGDGKPDLLSITQQLADVSAELAPEDLFLFFFSGHGIEIDGHGHLLVRDTPFAYPEHGSLSLALLRKTLSRLAAAQRVILLDTCRNAPEAGKGDAANALVAGLSKDIAAVTRTRALGASSMTTALFCACSTGQRAYEWPAKARGVFTHFLLEGLDGAAWEEGRLEFRTLAKYVADHVRDWSIRTPGLAKPQEPWYEEFGDPVAICLSAHGGATSPSKPRQSPTALVATDPVMLAPRQAPGTSARSSPRDAADQNEEAIAERSPRWRTAVLLLAIGLCASAAIALWKWNRHSVHVLSQASREVADGAFSEAIGLLDEFTPPFWHAQAKTRLHREASDLLSAHTAARAGEPRRVLALGASHPGDDRFAALADQALKTAEPSCRDKLAAAVQSGDYSVAAEIVGWYSGKSMLDDAIDEALRTLRERAIQSGRAGDVLTVESLNRYFPSDGSISAALASARLVAERAQSLAQARIDAEAGNVEDVARVLAAYPDDGEFTTLAELAAARRKRLDDLGLANQAATEGDLDKVRQVMEGYPADPAFLRAVERATAMRQRTDVLKAVQAAANKGDVDLARELCAAYEQDSEFQQELTRAASMRQYTVDTTAARAAAARGDLREVLDLATKHSQSSEFRSLVDELVQDAPYRWLPVGSALTKENRGASIKLVGRISVKDPERRSDGSVTLWFSLRDTEGTGEVRASLTVPTEAFGDKAAPAMSGVTIETGSLVTVWGVAERSTLRVDLIALGAIAAHSAATADLKGTKEQMSTIQPTRAALDGLATTIGKYISEEWIRAAANWSSLDRECRYRELPREGEYTSVTWIQIGEFKGRLHRKKARCTGTIVDNGKHSQDGDGLYFQAALAVDGSDGKGILQLKWRQPSTRGLSWRDSSAARDAFVADMNRYAKGTRWTVSGLFELRSGVFSETLQFDPVEVAEALK